MGKSTASDDDTAADVEQVTKENVGTADRGTAVRMFRVEVDPPPQGTFLSGSEIRGQVLVDTAVARNFKYIHVSLTGSAQVRVCP